MNANMQIREWLAGDWRVELDSVLASPERAQRRALVNILKSQRDSSFGTRHGFAGITSVEAFRAAVPVSDAMTLRSSIDLQRRNQQPFLTVDLPVTHFAGSQKGHIVPVTAAEIALRRRLSQFLADELSAETQALDGAIIDLSALDGLFADQRSPLGYGEALSDMPDLSQVEDIELRGYLVAMMALSTVAVSAIHAPDISALRLLTQIIDRHREPLFSDLSNGTLSVEGRVAPDLASAVLMRCEPTQSRLRTLRGVLLGGRPFDLADLWPSLRAVITDSSRHTQAAMDTDDLPAKARVIDLGCWTNEAIVTLPARVGENGGVPAVHDVFYEFAGPDSDEMLGLHEIGEGTAYRVFVTNNAGLYRFALPVIAEVVAWSGQFPLLQIKRVCGPATGRRVPMPDLRQASAAASVAVDISGTGATFCRVTRGATCGHFRIELPGKALPVCLSARLAALFDQQLRSRSLWYDRQRSIGALPIVEVHAISSAAKTRQPQFTCSVA